MTGCWKVILGSNILFEVSGLFGQEVWCAFWMEGRCENHVSWLDLTYNYGSLSQFIFESPFIYPWYYVDYIHSNLRAPRHAFFGFVASFCCVSFSVILLSMGINFSCCVASYIALLCPTTSLYCFLLLHYFYCIISSCIFLFFSFF